MQNIPLICRVSPIIRPLKQSEQKNGIRKIVCVSSKDRIFLNRSRDDSAAGYTFNEVFDDCASQTEIFRAVVSPITRDIIQGYNCTLFAYGACGSGKGYTMAGSTDSTETLGIMPRAINDVFQTLSGMDVEFNVRISYLEIFNEELVDLLSPSDAAAALKLFENSKGQTTINGLTEIAVSSSAEAVTALLSGEDRMKSSSRSHSILSIMVYVKEKPSVFDNDVELIKFSKLHLVKLAGNESVYRSATDVAPRIKLNQSLMSFNRVVHSLIEKQGHVPYRDSKLTRILQESLGGNSKTSIIATISPGSNCTEETVNTLEFATRAKGILNRPQINERLNKTVMLQNITIEINRLKQDLQANRTRSGVFLTEDSYSESINQLNESVHHVKSQKQQLKSLDKEQENLRNLFDDRYSNLQRQTLRINQADKAVQKLQRNQELLTHVAKQRAEAIAGLIASEKALLDQAQTTATVLTTAVGDASKLHTSIDRRREMDELLEAERKRFGEEIDGKVAGMKELLSMHSASLEEVLSDYSAKYGRTSVFSARPPNE